MLLFAKRNQDSLEKCWIQNGDRESTGWAWDIRGCQKARKCERIRGTCLKIHRNWLVGSHAPKLGTIWASKPTIIVTDENPLNKIGNPESILIQISKWTNSKLEDLQGIYAVAKHLPTKHLTAKWERVTSEWKCQAGTTLIRWSKATSLVERQTATIRLPMECSGNKLSFGESPAKGAGPMETSSEPIWARSAKYPAWNLQLCPSHGNQIKTGELF